MAHILIIDDDDIVAEMAAVLLTGEQHSCRWVASGEEALALLMVRRPDLILLDHDMPGMTGLQVLRQLRDSPRDRDLPVIMLTGASGIESEEAALFAGAQDCIRKPFDARSLSNKVSRLLRSRAELPALRTPSEMMGITDGPLVEIGRPLRRAVF